jgi:hypothetical protein
MKVEPRKQHQWLQKLVGNWTYESECPTGPDKPAQKLKGSETVRSLGGVWIVCEGQGEMPGGEIGKMIMTLGYDPRTSRFVGTWIGSMMANLWVYDGELDAEEKVLTLSAEGPDFSTEGKMAKYRDVIEIIDDDRRVLKSFCLAADGKWQQFMTANYRRSK